MNNYNAIYFYKKKQYVYVQCNGEYFFLINEMKKSVQIYCFILDNNSSLCQKYRSTTISWI